MKRLWIWMPVVILFTACQQERHHKLNPAQMAARMDSLRNDLLKTDIAFSQLSEQKGRNYAFMEYADSNATMLRKFSMPVTGRDSLAALLAEHPDSTFTLTWMPLHANVARSGDLGYTFGTYSLDRKGKGKSGGTYCTVWKKNSQHQWKYVLDTGNEGLKPEEQQ